MQIAYLFIVTVTYLLIPFMKCLIVVLLLHAIVRLAFELFIMRIIKLSEPVPTIAGIFLHEKCAY